MIDKEILDAVIPVPTLEEAKDEKVAELKEEGFVVTNFHSGGVFYTLLMVELRIKIELLQLDRVPRGCERRGYQDREGPRLQEHP